MCIRDRLWAVYEGDRPIAAVVTQITLGWSSEAAARGCLRSARADILFRRVREWADELLIKLELWARSLGCVALWGSGREGWDRIVERMGGTSIGSIAGFPAWERRL